MKKFKEFIAENSLHVFDIDDTLFHTTAQVHVKHGNKTVAKLSNSDYNNHKLEPGHHYDYSEFKSAEKFDTESKPVHKMMGKLKAIHKNVKAKGSGSKIIMNTARQDFDDKDRFLNTFRKHGVDIDDIHVHRAGNIKGKSVGEAKNEIVRQHLNKSAYHTVHLYDDSKTNLKHFLSLKKEHPHIEFNAHHVQPDGTTKKYHEDE